jgi:hypothetical protein
MKKVILPAFLLISTANYALTLTGSKAEGVFDGILKAHPDAIINCSAHSCSLIAACNYNRIDETLISKYTCEIK